MPKHATVVAYVALFAALGGTAYAATGGNFILGHSNKANQTTSLKNTGSGPALKLTTGSGATAPLAVSNGTKIAKLNADQVDGLSAGAFQKKDVAISSSNTSPNTDPVAGIGPWSMTLQRSSSGFARLKITGPGNAADVTTRSVNEGVANSFVSTIQPIGGGGYVATADTDEQVRWTVFLRSGSNSAEVNVILTADNGGLFEDCNVLGTAAVAG